MQWVVNGPLRGSKSSIDNDCQSPTLNRISIANLASLLVNQYNHDFNEKASEEKRQHSIEDKGFLEISVSPRKCLSQGGAGGGVLRFNSAEFFKESDQIRDSF